MSGYRPHVVLECSRSAGGLGIDVAMQGAPVVHASSMKTVLDLQERLSLAGIDVLLVRAQPKSRRPQVDCPQPTGGRAGANGHPVGALAFGVDDDL